MDSTNLKGNDVKIKVGFLTYKVEAIPKEVADAKGVYGYVNHTKQIIRVDEELSAERYKEVLLHEILHTVYNMWGINDGEQEEEIVNKMGNGLATVFRDNPKLKEILF